jgi:hypothetical protein
MLKVLKWATLSTFVAVVAASLVSQEGLAFQQQQQAATAHQDSQDGFETAANKWMKAPIDVTTQVDPVAAADRQARDAYWDGIIGASAPLSDPAARPRPTPISDALGEAPELGDLDQGVLIIGKFETYRTILSKSKRSIYTEIQFSVQHVFGHPSAPIQTGQLIDVDRPGGTIVAPWGSTLSSGLRPEQMGLEPQHVYLIRLGYDPVGNFYRGGSRTSELWDLTDGAVKPGNSLQKHRAERGMSELNGLSVDALIHLLDRKYAEHYAGRTVR